MKILEYLLIGSVGKVTPVEVVPTTNRDVYPERQEATEPFFATKSELRILLSGIMMLSDLYKGYKNTTVRKRLAIAEALTIRIQEALK